MRGLQIEVISGSVKVRRHGRNEICAMLSRISLTELDSGNFRDRIGFVRWLKNPGQKRFFLDGLSSKLRVNARTSEKKQLLHAEIETCRNQIVLDLQILQEKFDRKIVIGLNATDPCCRHHNGIGFICGKKLPDVLGVAQIQFTMCPNDDISVTVLLKVAKQRTAYQTPVAGNIGGSKRHRTSLVQVI